jgi:hypothetical protein
MLAKHALSQLSYGPGRPQRTDNRRRTFRPPSSVLRRPTMVGLGGLEPPTSRLSSARSNQLSYKPLAENGGRRTDDRKASVLRRPFSVVRKERETKAARSRTMRLRLKPLDSEPDDRTCRHRRTKDLKPSVLRPLSSAVRIQKGGDPAAGSPTATLLRLHPSR